MQDVCAASTLLNKGTDTFLDALGIIPGEGNVLKGVQAAASGLSLVKSIFSPSTPTNAALSATGAGITLVDLFKVIAKNPEAALVDGFVKEGSKVVPIVGNIVSSAALYNDIKGSDGVVAYYNDCLAGKN